MWRLRMFIGVVRVRASVSWPWRVGLLVAMVSIASGCSDTNFVPVSGRITHKDGSPVTAGMVIFEPENQKVSARGEIHADGTFQLGTNSNTDGAMEGDYKVLIAPPPLPEEGKRLRSPIAAKYLSLETTPLKCKVSRDRSKNKFNIEVD